MMEKKTKQRILGAVVILAIIIIIWPFFQSKKELTPINMPVPPAPPVEVLSNPAESNNPPGSMTHEPTAPAQEETSASPQQAAPTAEEPASPPVPNANPAPQAVTPQEERQPSSAEPDSSQPVAAEPATSTQPNQQTSAENVAPTFVKAIVPATKKPASHAIKKNVKQAAKKAALIKKAQSKKTMAAGPLKKSFAPINNNGLFQIKNAAWVVQVASYQQKAEALRLVKRLRTQGYAAFIQSMATEKETRIDVFVGPEAKLKSALQLTNRINKVFHVHGAVISYRPLS